MNTLKRLEEWVEEIKGRSVEIIKPNGYGPHDWDVILENVDIESQSNWIEHPYREDIFNKIVWASDNVNMETLPSYIRDAPNFIGIKEEDLEKTIKSALDLAEKLGL